MGFINNISLARVFIPNNTGFTRTARTFGMPRSNSIARSLYDDLAMIGSNLHDDKSKYSRFYDMIEAAYKINLSWPIKMPYVMYVDYLKSIGGGFSEDNEVVKQHLQEKCNTLILPADEFEYVQTEYMNLTYNEIGYVPYEHRRPIPARFEFWERQKQR